MSERRMSDAQLKEMQSEVGRYTYPPSVVANLAADLSASRRRVSELEAALIRTHSRLSLIRHRGNVRWDRPGELGAIGTEYECDRILGIAEAALAEAKGAGDE